MDFLTALTIGSSVFNTISNIKATSEQSKEYQVSLETQNAMLSRRYEAEQERIAEDTQQYSKICSYNIDMHRQKQLFGRQAIAYHLLKSGIAIGGSDSASQLIRLKAYSDEMAARAIENELYYKRPRAQQNKNLVDLNLNMNNKKISNLNSNLPWQQAAYGAKEIFNLIDIFAQTVK